MGEDFCILLERLERLESQSTLLQRFEGEKYHDEEVKYSIEMLKLPTAVGNVKTCHCQRDLEVVRHDTLWQYLGVNIGEWKIRASFEVEKW